MMIHCLVCGRSFNSGRQDAVTCSNACRQAKYRKMKAVNRVFKKKRIRDTRKQRQIAKFANPTIG